jgi:hypothetical protein
MAARVRTRVQWPVTPGIDIGVIKMILTHATAAHGLEIPVEAVALARLALMRLGLIGNGVKRDRRATIAELSRLLHRLAAVRSPLAFAGLAAEETRG